MSTVKHTRTHTHTHTHRGTHRGTDRQTVRKRERSASINPITDYGESSNIDTIHEKIKIERFKDNILQNLWGSISEIFDAV